MNLSSGKPTTAVTSQSTLCTLAIKSRWRLSPASKKWKEVASRDLFLKQGLKAGTSRKPKIRL